MWLRLEKWLFVKLHRRHIRRLTPDELDNWVEWHELDKALKRKGLA